MPDLEHHSSGSLEAWPLLHSQDLGSTLRQIAGLVKVRVPTCDRISVSLMSGDRIETRWWTDEVVCRLDNAQYAAGTGPCVDAIHDALVHQSDDLAQERRWRSFTSAALGEGIHAVLSLPLMVDGAALGALNLYADQAGAFSNSSRPSGLFLAESAAIAVANALAFSAAIDIAMTLQRSLLPERLPEVAGFELAVRYLPATAGTNVGGDWYDAVPRPGGGLTVTIGDVAGHGVRAASVMGQVRTALRAYAVERHPPSVAVGLLHRLFGQIDPDGLATLCYLTLDGGDGTCSVSGHWTSAGHCIPLVLDRAGAPSYLDGSPRPPLGAPFDEPTTDQPLTLDKGSMLLLYTDGLVERRGESLDAGLARLLDAASDAPVGLEGFCDHILERMGVAGELRDDVALMAVRVLALSCVAEA
ncbi:MAG: PP2C family protein-serine/threonine phosphatase [Acidimicrobiales bacterium]